MIIKLVDLQPRIVSEWQRAFGKYDNFEFYNNSVLEHKADGVVSPANSFADYSGGIDLVYKKHFGKKIQDDLQEMIKKRPLRELLVGECLVVETGNADIPHLLCCPTMRVPLDVRDTANPYLAFKAALIAATENGFKSIICPGLGTATGNVGPEDCARQMHRAYANFTDRYPKYPANIREAYVAHKDLIGIINMKKKPIYA
jgi:O-acetyl-ADP-ribose deacetylase (regulator of RNase III)